MNINQDICRKLVEENVIYCVSELIYELGQKEDFFEDVWPLQVREDYTEPVEWYIDNDMSIREAMEWLLNYNTDMPGRGNAKDQLKAFLTYDEDAMEEFVTDHNIEPNRIEVYEHWIVSDFFARKLKDKGEVVEDFMGMTIWGRCTTGQAILLDGVIKEIASDMEILQGQENSWENQI